MVTKRHVTITHKNSTRRIKTKRGCPQGGVLSPFLWNLVIYDLLQYTAKHIPGYIQAFADDIMSLAKGDDLDVIWQRTQTTIKTIENRTRYRTGICIITGQIGLNKHFHRIVLTNLTAPTEETVAHYIVQPTHALEVTH